MVIEIVAAALLSSVYLDCEIGVDDAGAPVEWTFSLQEDEGRATYELVGADVPGYSGSVPAMFTPNEVRFQMRENIIMRDAMVISRHDLTATRTLGIGEEASQTPGTCKIATNNRAF